MTLRALAAGILNGTISIDQNGHDPFYGWGEKKLKERLKERVDHYEAMRTDGNPEHAKMYERVLSYDGGTKPSFELFEGDCSHCGKRLMFHHAPESNSIKCISISFGKGLDMTTHPERCRFEVEGPLHQIFHAHGPVVFANFFREQMDAIPKDREYRDFSLNNFAGRHALTAFHTEQNCVYSQTGNMRVYFYINKKKDHVIVIEHEEDGYEDGKPYVTAFLKKWIKLGEVTCDMWRWMLVNASDIKNPKRSVGGEKFGADLPLGTWDISHYIRTDSDRKVKLGRMPLLSEMKLRK